MKSRIVEAISVVDLSILEERSILMGWVPLDNRRRRWPLKMIALDGPECCSEVRAEMPTRTPGVMRVKRNS